MILSFVIIGCIIIFLIKKGKPKQNALMQAAKVNNSLNQKKAYIAKNFDELYNGTYALREEKLGRKLTEAENKQVAEVCCDYLSELYDKNESARRDAALGNLLKSNGLVDEDGNMVE